ncbi:MAG: alpha/beta fold hydrolase [Limisphaerales bacterium]
MATPALILIHGYPFDHTLWDYVVGPLRKVTTVLTPDLPGFGGQPVLPTDPSIDVMADEIAKLFVNEHMDRAVIVGMSMGGYVALSLAERYRHRLAGLGLISTQAVADTVEARQQRQEMIEKVRAEGPTSAAQAAINKLFAPGNRDNSTFREFPEKGARRAGTEGIIWALQAMANRPDRSALLQHIHFPTLVVHGTEDQFIPVERARQMSGVIPDCEYAEISGAGHAIPLESPEPLIEELLGLLDRAEAAEPHLEGLLNRPGVVISPTDQGL